MVSVSSLRIVIIQNACQPGLDACGARLHLLGSRVLCHYYGRAAVSIAETGGTRAFAISLGTSEAQLGHVAHAFVLKCVPLYGNAAEYDSCRPCIVDYIAASHSAWAKVHTGAVSSLSPPPLLNSNMLHLHEWPQLDCMSPGGEQR